MKKEPTNTDSHALYTVLPAVIPFIGVPFIMAGNVQGLLLFGNFITKS